MNQKITKRQKSIIDRWQENFPEHFPSKPAPKVYLDLEQRSRYINIAIDVWGESPDDSVMAMIFWRQGKRWEEATLTAMQDIVSHNLTKDFSELFAAKDEEDLKLAINKLNRYDYQVTFLPQCVTEDMDESSIIVSSEKYMDDYEVFDSYRELIEFAANLNSKVIKGGTGFEA